MTPSPFVPLISKNDLEHQRSAKSDKSEKKMRTGEGKKGSREKGKQGVRGDKSR